MNKRKTFVCIFAGVTAAGLLGLGLAFLLRALITGNGIVTIVTLFMMIGGGIMAGLGLIAVLICCLLLAFGGGDKNKHNNEQISSHRATDSDNTEDDDSDAIDGIEDDDNSDDGDEAEDNSDSDNSKK